MPEGKISRVTPKPSVSLVIPAHNEKETVERSILKNVDTLSRSGLDFEIVVVDDFSTDGTAEIIERVAKRCDRVQWIRNPKNLGIGGAFRRGLKAATRDYVMLVPVDNPLDGEDLKAFLPRFGMCDIVVGTRSERVGYTKFAAFASFTYNRLLVPLLFNVGISDINWIQAYRRAIFSEGKIEFKSNQMFFFVEILVQARRNRLIIAEVPSKMNKRVYGKPTCSKPSTMGTALKEMLVLFYKTQTQVKA